MNENKPLKRTIKDSVFTHLFQDKQYVLQLFQALHPEAQGITEDMIELVTIENVLVDNIYNDLGFLIGAQLIVLVEAQVTWTVNIIIRIMLYMAETYRKYIRKKDLNLYGSQKVHIPKPELYVIYTGDKKIPSDVISLSEEFFGGEATDIDVRVHILTDSTQGDIINQYITFTKVLDEQVKLHGRTEQAVLETIRICRDKDVLAKYLTEHEQEVLDIMTTLFDEEFIMRAYTKEKLEEGRAAGRMEGRAEGMERGRAEGRADVARNMLRNSEPIDKIALYSGLPISEISALKAQMQQQALGG